MTKDTHKDNLKSESERLVLLTELVKSDPTLNAILSRADQLNLPNWYLGASCITQVVWNYISGTKPSYESDYDLVYFDDRDLSKEAEEKVDQRSKALFNDLGVNIEITNEARVHLWYKEEFGKDISAYTSTEEAIDSWPTTSNAIGVRYSPDGKFEVYAPYGTEDLFNLELRPNKKMVTEEMFKRKVQKWTKFWPDLKVIAW